MKFVVVLTVFALIATGLALPVDNLESSISELNSLIPDDVFIRLTEEKPDQECQDIADELKSNLNKLQKIQQGLRKDNLNKLANALNKPIELSKKFSEVEKVAENKTGAKRLLGVVRFIIKVGKKYLEEENTIVSVNDNDEEVDDESKRIAEYFKTAIPKLTKIRDGLKKDGHERQAAGLTRAIEVYTDFCDANIVAKNKSRAKVALILVKVVIKLNQKYLEDEKSEEALAILSLMEEVNEAHLADGDVDEESKEIAKFFEESLPKLEKIRDGLKRDNRIKQSEYLQKAIDLYRPFTNPQTVAEQKNTAKVYSLLVKIVLKLNKKYLEE